MKISILIIISLLFLGCQSSNSAHDKDIKIKKIEIKKQEPSVNIIENQTITSPLPIEFKSNSAWFAHEGELDTVSLIDADGNQLGLAILSVTDGEWMSTDPLTSAVSLKFTIKNTTSAKLVFKNNNPSTTEGINKIFEIGVLLEKVREVYTKSHKIQKSSN